MKTRLTAAALFLTLVSTVTTAASAAPARYLCASDSVEWTITIDMGRRVAAMTGEGADALYPFVGTKTERLPAQHVFGIPGDCSVRFTAYPDGHTGLALFGCDARKDPGGARAMTVECMRVR